MDIRVLNTITQHIANIHYILKDYGYNVPDIEPIYVDNNYLPSLILNYFNNQEANMQKIDSVVDWVNPYSNVFKWKKQNGMLAPHIQRWQNWTDYNSLIVSGEIEKEQYLKTKEYGVELQLFDENGEKILTQEGYIA